MPRGCRLPDATPHNANADTGTFPIAAASRGGTTKRARRRKLEKRTIAASAAAAARSIDRTYRLSSSPRNDDRNRKYPESLQAGPIKSA
jgi:hypothetical protein